MRTWIVSYANASFQASQKRLLESALKYGIDEPRPWDNKSLEQTPFYKMFQTILDKPRGSGYWLWKPFIIKETLKEMDDGDVVIYSDAGIEIVGDLSPLIELCRHKNGILLFAGHYDDVGAPGPNICSKWTKRDCFIFMDCDEPRYYQSQMLDASFLVLAKTERSIAFIREWLVYCCQSQILIDQPNLSGLLDLPDFVEHRHDQSILSLMAHRDGLELFRHPSQYGNHLKDEPYRDAGEWARHDYGTKGIYYNSPYHTLLHHHRGEIGQQDLRLRLSRIIPASRRKVFRAWTRSRQLKKWLSSSDYALLTATINLRVGGEYHLKIMELASGRMFSLDGKYIEVSYPDKLVYSWDWGTRITVEFYDREGSTEIVFMHELFPSERVRDRHAAVWNAALDRLVETFSNSSPILQIARFLTARLSR